MSLRLYTPSRSYGHGDLEEIRERSLDGEFIADMIVPLLGPVQEGGIDAWACRHFDGRDCTVYEQRPHMCRYHGVTHACSEPGCTFEAEPLELVRVRLSR